MTGSTEGIMRHLLPKLDEKNTVLSDVKTTKACGCEYVAAMNGQYQWWFRTRVCAEHAKEES